MIITQVMEIAIVATNNFFLLNTGGLASGLTNPNDLERIDVPLLETSAVSDGLYDEIIKISEQLLFMYDITQERLENYN